MEDIITDSIQTPSDSRINQIDFLKLHPQKFVNTQTPNIHVWQLFYSGEFTIDFALSSHHYGMDNNKEYTHTPKSKLVGDELTKKINRAYSEFNKRFDDTFDLKKQNHEEHMIDFGKMVLGNMLGGLGYFYGSSIVDRAIIGVEKDVPIDFLVPRNFENDQEEAINDYYNTPDYYSSENDHHDVDGSRNTKKGKMPAPNPQLEPPQELFTGVPSSSFFPRGFLWDSGFDQYILSVWDSDLAVEILNSWMSLIDSDGWIAREQILGDEPRSRVPKEFQVQYPNFANPPTLLSGLELYLERISNHSILMTVPSDNVNENFEAKIDDSFQEADKDNEFGVRYNHKKGTFADDLKSAYEKLAKLYPKFVKQYEWFLKTQWGQVKLYTDEDDLLVFRWRGKRGSHILTSGMDDYPRAPGDYYGELHVDLLSWMIYFSKTLEQAALKLNLPSDASRFALDRKKMTKSLFELHWDSDSESFTDVAVNPAENEIESIVHKGYVSILPLALGILDADSDKLGKILKLINDPKEIWSKFGLCSLSKSDDFFGKDENYWRGPIWINLNYMVLKTLYKTYMRIPGPYQALSKEIYTKLRENILKNVYSEYKRTGFIWEQYDCRSGRGQRNHPFNGFSSLVLLILAERY